MTKKPDEDTALVPVTVTETHRRENEAAPVELGQWYWLENWAEKHPRVLGCVTHLGSNYAEIDPVGDYAEVRILESEFDECCTREENPETYIKERIAHHQHLVDGLLDRVKQLTASLGITRLALNESAAEMENTTQALVAVHGTKNVKAHKVALVKAKEKTLPELFKKIRDQHEKMAMWMTATLKPHKAQAKALKKTTEVIDDRIFTVELYAGLVEEMVQIKEGDPASNETKVALFQRRHYMDEECLANYSAGGMSFESLGAFDRWLVRKDNLERILPLRRCIVAFRVRRYTKTRRCYNISDFFRIQLKEKQDEYTFLYIRNGEQVWRLATEIDFGEQLFPNKEDSLLLGDSDCLWANVYWSEVREIISDDAYQQMLKDHAAEQKAYKKRLKAWRADPKNKKHVGTIHEPSNPKDYRSDKWVKIDKESVWYDDVMMKIAREAMAHNRVAVVLQGVLDRSAALQPHPPWQLWTAEGFQSGIELIYDVSRALTSGEAPDFEEFRQRINESLGKGCFTVGQERAWEIAEAEKENEKRSENRWDGGYYEVEFYHPHGNPGPGVVAEVTAYSRKKRTCTFKWMRPRERGRWITHPTKLGYRQFSYDGDIGCRFACSQYVLLNVSAYTPGDFKQFYADPRTRADYAQWAPLLLAAEDWHHEQKKAKKKGEKK